MSENNATSVSVAFDLLLDAVETEMDAVSQVGAEAFEGRDYDSVRKTLEHADQIKAFREKIVALREEWEKLEGTQTRRANLEEDSQEERETEEEVPFLPLPEEEAPPLQQAHVEGEAIPVEYSSTSIGRRSWHTPRKVYYPFILEVLCECGGFAEQRDLREKLEQTMKGTLREADYEITPSSEIYWHHMLREARLGLQDQGLLKRNSPRGIWELSEAGRSFCK